MGTWSLGAAAVGGPGRPWRHRTGTEEGAVPEPGPRKARSRLWAQGGPPTRCGVRGSVCSTTVITVIEGFPRFREVL